MDAQTIKKILQKNALFQSCNTAELNEIYDQSSFERYMENDIIIHEGDLADALYFIVHGSVQVFTRDEEGTLVVLARLDEEQFFGEQAYLNNFIRTASIRAHNTVELVKINYDILDTLFKRSKKLRQYLQKATLDLCLSNLLAKLSHIESYVKKLFLEKSFFSSKTGTAIQYYKKDDIIFKKGDASNSVYFISSGSIALSFGDDKHNDLIINKNEMFGEVGVMHNKPRSGTAIASSSTTLIVVSAKNFLKAIEKANSLKSMTVAFNQVYALPKNKAIAEQFITHFEGNEAIFTKYKLKNGNVATCAKVINQAIFTIKILHVSPTKILSYKKGDFIQRSVGIDDNKIVSLTIFGEWDQINILCSMLFEGVKIHGCSEADFAKTGSLISLSSNTLVSNKNEDIICNCMAVTYQVLKDKIDSGCTNFEKLSEATGASTACGSCRDTILDMLGQSAWISATLQLNKHYGEDIASFLIKPLYSQFVPFISGQYIILKLQINGLWIERAYTLISRQHHTDAYEVIIKKNQQGALSEWLFEQSNDPIFLWISSPNGAFTLNNPLNKSMVGFAGGIGITPFIAFIRALNSQENPPYFHILYAVDDVKNAVIPPDIKKYLDQNQNLSIEIWDTSSQGLMDETVIEKTLKSNRAEQVYLCGSDSFMRFIGGHLDKMGIAEKDIFREEFLPAV